MMDTQFFPVRVYFSDTDAGGIVYHARYLDFAEHARTELFCAISNKSQRELLSEDFAFVVKSIKIDYKSPAFLDDRLVVETSLKECKHFSFIFNQDVMRDDTLIAHLEISIASVSKSKMRPVPLPDFLIEKLNS